MENNTEHIMKDKKIKFFFISETRIDPETGQISVNTTHPVIGTRDQAFDQMKNLYVDALQELNLDDNGTCDEEENAIPGGYITCNEAGIYNYVEFAFGQMLEIVSFTLSEFTGETPVVIAKEKPEGSDPDKEKIKNALEIAWRYSQIDGSHHKAWSIDQMVRALCGTDEEYKKWVEEYEKPDPEDDDPDDHYCWDVGIAP